MVVNANWLSRLPHKQLIVGSNPTATTKFEEHGMSRIKQMAAAVTNPIAKIGLGGNYYVRGYDIIE